MKRLLITECPRDAMQGMPTFIPTSLKVSYLNRLLQCGFETLDFGSFVSAKAIPQLQDTTEVLAQLQPSATKLLAIVANERGAQEACQYERISILGYPFSVSEQFQLRNTNSTIEQSLHRVEALVRLCDETQKELRVYLSMGFGNPYQETWSPELVCSWSERLVQEFGISQLALSDTIGCATPTLFKSLFPALVSALPDVQFSAHLHLLPQATRPMLEAAIAAGCYVFDSAVKGYGGCPMAADQLTGNLATEKLIQFANDQQLQHGIDMERFNEALEFSNQLFHS